MIVLQALVEYKKVHDCQEQWVNAPYARNHTHVNVCFRSEPHSQKRTILNGKVHEAKHDEAHQISLDEFSINYDVLVEPEVHSFVSSLMLILVPNPKYIVRQPGDNGTTGKIQDTKGSCLGRYFTYRFITHRKK